MARVHKNWCFTLFSDDLEVACALLMVKWAEEPLLTYAIAGKEKCPDTSRLHAQGYIQCNKRVSLNTMLNLFLAPEWQFHPHLEPQRASDNKQAITYCKKDGDIIIEMGEPNFDKAGTRNDLKRVREAIVAGKSLNDLFREEPDLYGTLVRNGRGIERSCEPLCKRPYRGPVEAEWHFGPTGFGKSFWAYAQAAEGEEAYTKDNSKWWDGYDGEKVIVWDDIRGGKEYPAQFVDMLRLLDGRFTRGQNKGGFTRISPEKVIFTSPINIYEWGGKYFGSEEIRQLRRRVGRIIQWTGYKQYTVIKPCPAVAVVGHAASYNP